MSGKSGPVQRVDFKPKAWLTLSKKPVQEGDLVYVAGYPRGTKKSLRFATGKVKSVVTTLSSSIKGDVFITNIDGGYGMSGSPTLDRDGNIIGLFYGGEMKETDSDMYHISSLAIAEELRFTLSCSKLFSKK